MAEPVTRELAKLNARIDGSTEDDLVDGWIVTGREWVEKYTGLILTRRTVVETLASFGPWIDLQSWPIASIDSIAYIDPALAPQVLATDAWIAGTAMRPVRIVAAGNMWPALGRSPSAVTVTVTAGYATPAEVPATLKSAILLIVAGLYDDRKITPEVERAARALCWYYRRKRV